MTESLQRQIIDASLELGALTISVAEPFTWASGYRMPVYNDNRRLLSSPRARSLVRDGFIAMIESMNLTFDAIAGTASAGIAPATTLADSLAKPLYYVRGNAKGHGMGRQIEGAPETGINEQSILLIEDLVSTGGSSADAAEALIAGGATVPACLAIFTYGFDAATERFARISGSPRLAAICTMHDLIVRAQETGRISHDEERSLRQWITDPFRWGERNGFSRVDAAGKNVDAVSVAETSR